MKNEIINRLARSLFCLGRISVAGRENIDNMKEVFDRIDQIVTILNECEVVPLEKASDEATKK